ncbi:hypothetical protein ACGGAQ_15380 [Micromonospora sp. NPDC047557]|uniref:hypothetical protein n=1 Tax=Micromonospora sp. NPDC047557 TaxID=3364250 RepID=UPI00371BD7FA
MPELPAARDDAATEQPPPLELSREPHDGARDAYDAHDGDRVDDHESHDPYQPL